jgi:DNA polymerase V
MLLRERLNETGLTATAGIGTNMYLCKVAMDIVAKHAPADRYGARIAELDEMSYRRLLWDHRPITDFWRVGPGYRKKLEANGLYTMGDIARCSVGDIYSYYNESLLFKLFGVNAELLIDHAWGYESCTIADIKAYKPTENSVSSGQVLQRPYNYREARLIVREMADLLSLDLVGKRVVTDQLVLIVGYDVENLLDPQRAKEYRGTVTVDRYGRRVPKHARGTIHLKSYTSSTKLIMDAATELYDRIINKSLTVRRINITACRVIPEKEAEKRVVNVGEQMSMFVDYEELDRKREAEKEWLERERKMQNTIIEIKKKYGKNAILRGMNLEESATAKDRNSQIGGHKA